MALVFVKMPGANDRALVNAVPGLRRHGSCGLHRPLTGAALRLEKRREMCGIVLGWTSLVLSIVFFCAVLLGILMQGSLTELDSMIFACLWAVTAIVVHLGVFLAEALRGRDAPRAVLGVVVFWVAMVVLWVV